jgi:hypothetical protein
LLTEAAQTGHVPTDAQIGTVFRHGSSSERDGAMNGIRTAAKRIASIRRGDTDSDDHEADIAEVIEDVAERFQHLTDGAADKPSSSRDLAAQIAKRQAEGVAGREKRSAKAAVARKAREPLQELLAAATSGRAVKKSDLDEPSGRICPTTSGPISMRVFTLRGIESRSSAPSEIMPARSVWPRK